MLPPRSSDRNPLLFSSGGTLPAAELGVLSTTKIMLIYSFPPRTRAADTGVNHHFNIRPSGGGKCHFVYSDESNHSSPFHLMLFSGFCFLPPPREVGPAVNAIHATRKEGGRRAISRGLGIGGGGNRELTAKLHTLGGKARSGFALNESPS